VRDEHPQLVLCPACHGQGKGRAFTRHPMVCLTCNGAGKVMPAPEEAQRPALLAALSEALAKIPAVAVEVYLDYEPRPGYLPSGVVLAKRLRPVFPSAPYVTWSFTVNGLYAGHYDLTEAGGRDNFALRVDRERS